jgi:integrase
VTDKPRKVIARHGRRGAWVKVILVKGHELVRVQWKEAHDSGISGTQSWPNTKENRATAKAYAEGLAERVTKGDVVRTPKFTNREIWDMFATANFPHLRPRSQKLYAENFRRWALVWGWEFIADNTTLEMADEFRAASMKIGLSTSTIRKTIYDVKMVYAWAEAREHMVRNKLRRYRFKVAKEDRPTPIEEYRSDEFAKILSQLSPYKRNGWRAYVVLGLCGFQGARQHAVLHLGVDDVQLGQHVLTDLGFAWIPGKVTWRSRWDKTGTEREQPLRLHAQILIEIALEWRELNGYTGPWLFPTASRKSKRDTYSPQSLWAALVGAEARGGVRQVDRRAAHSLRRMLAGDVTAATGDFMLGLQAIGDNDPRMAARYIRTRQDRVLDAFARMDVDRADLPAAENRSVYVERNRDGTRGGKGQGSKADVAVMRINANSDSEPVATQTSKTEPSRNAGQKEAGASGETPAEVQQLQGVTE